MMLLTTWGSWNLYAHGNSTAFLLVQSIARDCQVLTTLQSKLGIEEFGPGHERGQIPQWKKDGQPAERT